MSVVNVVRCVTPGNCCFLQFFVFLQQVRQSANYGSLHISQYFYRKCYSRNYGSLHRKVFFPCQCASLPLTLVYKLCFYSRHARLETIIIVHLLMFLQPLCQSTNYGSLHICQRVYGRSASQEITVVCTFVSIFAVVCHLFCTPGNCLFVCFLQFFKDFSFLICCTLLQFTDSLMQNTS